MYDAILKHLEDPACSHLKPLIYDIVSTMQNLENELKNRIDRTATPFTIDLGSPTVSLQGTVVQPVGEEHHTIVPPLGKPSPV
jgi:hypothetical protein